MQYTIGFASHAGRKPNEGVFMPLGKSFIKRNTIFTAGEGHDMLVAIEK